MEALPPGQRGDTADRILQPGRASEGELGDHSDYRNPIITAGLVEMGYVQQLGRGIRRVRLLLSRSGSPPLDVEKDGFTRVIMRARQ